MGNVTPTTIRRRAMAPIDATALKTVAALMDDPNPIHWDVEAVKARGLGDRPVVQGPVTISALIDLALDFAGPGDRLLDLNARFLRPVFAGDSVDCSGRVVSREGGRMRIELRAAVSGTPVALATATLGRGNKGD